MFCSTSMFFNPNDRTYAILKFSKREKESGNDYLGFEYRYNKLIRYWTTAQHKFNIYCGYVVYCRSSITVDK